MSNPRFRVAPGCCLSAGHRTSALYPEGSVIVPTNLGMTPEETERRVVDGTLLPVEPSTPEVRAPNNSAAPVEANATAVETERTDDGGEGIVLEELSKKELVAEAAARGITTKSRWNRADLISAIETHDAAEAAEPTHMLTKWSIDPSTLSEHSLDDLNLMIAERSGGSVGPFDTVPECIAQLSMDWKA